MPDNTRPRIVNTDYMTPALNPNAPDPRQLIEGILNPAMQPAPLQPGILENVINALANGASIGFSNDPGAALQNQLRQQSQQKFEQEQARQDFNRRLDLMGRQFGLQETANQLDEQRQIGREQRQQAYREKERQSDFDMYIKKNNVEYQQDLNKMDKQADARKAEAILEHKFKLEYQDRIDARADQTNQRLENKELFDKKISLITAGIPAGMANKIASKMFKGEDLTPQEAATITAAARRQLNLASGVGRKGSGSGSSGGGLTAKQMFQYMNVRMKDQFVKIKNPDGTESIVEMSNAPKDSLTGEIQGYVGIATAAEKMAKLSEEVGSIESLLSPQEKAKANNVPKEQRKYEQHQGEGPSLPDAMLMSPSITPQQKAAIFYKQQFEAAVKQGVTKQLAERMLRDKVATEAPQDMVVLDGIFGKSKGKKNTLGSIMEDAKKPLK